MRKAQRRRLIIVAAVLGLAAVELVRTAWISDDSAITLRTVLNLVHGFGATFNIDERVQAFTHPLWFLLISATTLVTGNVFVATFILSIAISFVVLRLLLTRVAFTLTAGVLGTAALVCSKAYVDFSTSGLENPLSHLLIIVALLAAVAVDTSAHRLAATGFFLTCSALYLSRPDLVVLIAPLAVFVVFRTHREPALLLRAMTIGALPAVAWTLFSLYYYGFPFPNTAYAKLGAGIPAMDLAAQGGEYLRDSLTRDPITLVVIVLAVGFGFASSAVNAALGTGTALYIAYVVSIGGDFMSGRFLTAPLLAAVAILSRARLTRWQFGTVAFAVAGLGIYGIDATLLSGSSYAGSFIPENGITDERAYYFQRYGLTTAPRHTFEPPAWEVGKRSVMVLCGDLGMTGIQRGPGTHLIDTCALSDPLLARLPAERTRRWRIGHFLRQLPTDYEESVAQGGNVLADARTREFYRSIRLITRGPLNSSRRLREIARMNFGQVPRPDWDMYHHTKVPESSRSSAAEP